MNDKEHNTLTRRRWLQGLGMGTVAAAAAKLPVPAEASVAAQHRHELRAGKLSTTIADNHDGLSGQQQIDRRARMPVAADGDERFFCTVPYEQRFNGYNGVVRLHNDDSRSPYLPCAAGHNCEFFFDQRGRSYEPRWTDQPKFIAQPSSLTAVSDSAARLTIAPGPKWAIQVESQFQLVEPFYLDIEHSFTPTDRSKISGPVLGVFWASYIQVPREPAIYFRSVNGKWTNIHAAVGHGQSGVVAPLSGSVGTRLVPPDTGGQLLYGVGEMKYGTPLYCGQVHGMLLSYMFQPGEDVEIRFAYNPSGGGPGVPAWDYQALVADPQPGKRYSFKTRTVCKPYKGLDESLDLYRRWTG